VDLYDRITRVRGKELGLSKTSIFKRVLQQRGRIDTVYYVVITVICIYSNNNNNNKSREPLSTTRKKAVPRSQSNSLYQYSLSCRHGSTPSVLLPWTRPFEWISPCRGCTMVNLTLEPPDLVRLIQASPTKESRHTVAHPSNSTERPSAGLHPKHRGVFGPLPPSTPARCVRGRCHRLTSHYRSRWP